MCLRSDRNIGQESPKAFCSGCSMAPKRKRAGEASNKALGQSKRKARSMLSHATLTACSLGAFPGSSPRRAAHGTIRRQSSEVVGSEQRSTRDGWLLHLQAGGKDVDKVDVLFNEYKGQNEEDVMGPEGA